MKKKVIKEIGADTLPILLKKANELGIKKEQYWQIVELHGSYHMIYVGN